jgi:hypothetical protein
MMEGGKMKFMVLSVVPVEKVAEVSASADKVWAGLPKESRPKVIYMMLCIPQFNVPPNSLVTFAINEDDSAENFVAREYPQMLAGATVQVIPLLETPLGVTAKAEKKYRG